MNRELDALVAEKVMGLGSMPEDAVLLNDCINKSPGSCGSPSLQVQRNFLKNPDYWGHSTLHGLKVNYHRHYSTSISDAWLVVEEMHNRGFVCHVTYDLGGPYKFICEFENQNGEGEVGDSEESMCEAICHSAIKAV